MINLKKSVVKVCVYKFLSKYSSCIKMSTLLKPVNYFKTLFIDVFLFLFLVLLKHKKKLTFVNKSSGI